jgi:hypothetical protein
MTALYLLAGIALAVILYGLSCDARYYGRREWDRRVARRQVRQARADGGRSTYRNDERTTT